MAPQRPSSAPQRPTSARTVADLTSNPLARPANSGVQLSKHQRVALQAARDARDVGAWDIDEALYRPPQPYRQAPQPDLSNFMPWTNDAQASAGRPAWAPIHVPAEAILQVQQHVQQMQGPEDALAEMYRIDQERLQEHKALAEALKAEKDANAKLRQQLTNMQHELELERGARAGLAQELHYAARGLKIGRGAGVGKKTPSESNVREPHRDGPRLIRLRIAPLLEKQLVSAM